MGTYLTNTLTNEYLSGAGIKPLAKKHGIPYPKAKKILMGAGIKLRTGSERNSLSWVKYRDSFMLNNKVPCGWNKGKKGCCNTGRTHFKKGQTPWNADTRSADSSLLRRTMRSCGRKIKCSHYIWLRDNRFGLCFIPKGWVVHHLDRNPSNDTIDNLVILPKGEHTRLHNLIAKKIIQGGL